MGRTPQSDAYVHRPAGKEINSKSRRKFLGNMGIATVAAGVLGKAPAGFAQSQELTEWVRHIRRAGLRGHAGRNCCSCAEPSVVPKVADSPDASPRGRRRGSASDSKWEQEQDRRSVEQQCSELASGGAELQHMGRICFPRLSLRVPRITLPIRLVTERLGGLALPC
jgi:hypothetical protein